MIRAIAPIALVLGLSLAAAPAAADALLRSRVIVEDENVKLGDIFDNAGEKADVTVMRAPAPGQRVTVDTDWLQHIALVYGVTWHPRDLFEESSIERAGVVIGRDQILDTLQQALTQQGASPDALVDIDGRVQQMVVPIGSSAQLTVRDLYYDHNSNHFNATLAVDGRRGDAARLTVSGHLYPTLQIPVLNRMVPRGDVVAAQDVIWIKMREEQVRPVMLADADQIVGMIAKQQLRPNLPLTAGDLQKPLAVTRGATVTLVLNQGGMALSAQGRALDQGSLGDVVRITNTRSNLTVEGTIDGTNHVRVTLTGPVASAN